MRESRIAAVGGKRLNCATTAKPARASGAYAQGVEYACEAFHAHAGSPSMVPGVCLVRDGDDTQQEPTFKDRIEELRLKAGLSVKELADACGASPADFAEPGERLDADHIRGPTAGRLRSHA